MKRNCIKNLLVSAAIILAAGACSTTRLIPEGQYRLKSNDVVVVGDEDFQTSKITPYIKQKPSWSPMLYVYNWAGRDSSWMSNLLRSIGTAPVVLDTAQTRMSAENMERQMEYLGYYRSSISTETETKGKSATVRYTVKPGRRYLIRGFHLQLPENEEFNRIFLADSANITIHKGDYLSMAALESETVRAAAYLREKGFYDINKTSFTFLADTLSSDGTADLTMRVAQAPEGGEAPNLTRFKFGNVSISYPKTIRFRETFLKRMNAIKPKKTYSESAINTTYSRFSALAALSGTQITLERSTFYDDAVDCQIELTPAKQRGVKLNLEASSNSNGLIGISPEITYYSRNILGGSEVLNLGLNGDWQFKPRTNIRSTEFGVNGSLTFAKFLLLPTRWFPDRVPQTQIKASFNFQDRPEYKRNLFSTSYSYLWSGGKFYYQLTPLRVSYVKLRDIDEEFWESIEENPFLSNAYLSHFDAGTSFTLYYTTNNSVVLTGSYHYFRLNVDLSGNVLDLANTILKRKEYGIATIGGIPYSQYVRGELTLGKTWSLGEATTLASRVLMGAGYAYGNSMSLPFEKQFFSGGANSLRGWQARTVGPGDAERNTYFVIPSQTGDVKFEANLELRFPVVGIFNGAVFIDAGNVWTLKKSYDKHPDGEFILKDIPRTLAADWGIGLRVNLSVLLLRLDMGLRFHDPSLKGSKWLGPKKWFHRNGNAIHFAVGYPF